VPTNPCPEVTGYHLLRRCLDRLHARIRGLRFDDQPVLELFDQWMSLLFFHGYFRTHAHEARMGRLEAIGEQIFDVCHLVVDVGG
jgi:hypothetical protein